MNDKCIHLRDELFNPDNTLTSKLTTSLIDLDINYNYGIDSVRLGSLNRGKRVIVKVFPYLISDGYNAVTRHYNDPFTLGYHKFENIHQCEECSPYLDIDLVEGSIIKRTRNWIIDLRNTELAGMVDDIDDMITLSEYSFRSYGLKWEESGDYYICTVYVAINERSFETLKRIPGTSTTPISYDIESLNRITHDNTSVTLSKVAEYYEK